MFSSKISRARGVTPPLYVCVTSPRASQWHLFPREAGKSKLATGPHVEHHAIRYPLNLSRFRGFFGAVCGSAGRPRNAGHLGSMVIWPNRKAIPIAIQHGTETIHTKPGYFTRLFRQSYASYAHEATCCRVGEL